MYYLFVIIFKYIFFCFSNYSKYCIFIFPGGVGRVGGLFFYNKNIIEIYYFNSILNNKVLKQIIENIK